MTSDERGFTLVELIVAVVILGIITLPIGNAIIVALKTTGAASDRLSRAQDVQIASATFASDVESSDQVHAGTGLVYCVGQPAAFVLQFVWTDTEVNAATINASTYAVVNDPSSGENRLVRFKCTNGTLASQRVMSHSVQSTSPAACDGAACPATAPSGTSAVAFSVVNPEGDSFSLRGTRRVG